ncbi:MAG: alpha/beta fold hydrolase [Phenylobacterium sp.]|uniref:alpha/beta fold hydrolase n=1 Tax=Phenylobacterium sp. TaxID=1871053 RepID=UPI0025EE0937|nr:alpha/beta fold hydrolase [Phenylobacterium sp.]MBI1198674.1 alpha/beta fold hydrolase [Phenylobacterium sp.]
MPSIDVDGATLNYTVRGRAGKPWVTVSHSLGGDMTLWDALAEHLAPDFQVLQYDTRGHGRSRAAHAEFTVERLGDDVVALWDAVGAVRSHFIGLSLGGMLGQGLALNHRERLDKLVLCDCRADSSDDFRALWDMRIAQVSASGAGAVVDGTLEKWVTPQFRTANPQVMSAIGEIIRGTSVNGYVGCARAIQNLAFGPRLGQITTPTLLLSGGEDLPHPEILKRMSAAIPGATYAEVPDAAHLPNVEQPAAFNRVISEFLA